MVDKSPDAFRTISEVAEDLDLPQHVLRFWETRFVQIKPLKRGGGRRYYRPDDVELLRAIRHLLYGEGYTIRGVQRILKEQGPRAVAQLAAGGAQQAAAAVPAMREEPVFERAPQAAPRAAPPLPFDDSHMPPAGPSFAPPGEPEPALPEPAAVRPRPAFDFADDEAAEAGAVPSDSVEPMRLPAAAETPAPYIASDRLTPENLQRLQAALFELDECRKMLESARNP